MSARAPRRLSPWRRLAALLLDYLVIFAWMTVLAVASLTVFLTMGDSPDVLGAVGPFGAQAVFFTLLTLPVGLYLYLSESGPAQATWGKRRMGLVVRSLDGARPGRGQIAIRTVVKLLPWEISHTLIWQMQAVFHRSGYEAEIPTWIFVGLGEPVAGPGVAMHLKVTTGRAERRGEGRDALPAQDGAARRAVVDASLAIGSPIAAPNTSTAARAKASATSSSGDVASRSASSIVVARRPSYRSGTTTAKPPSAS